MGDGGTPPVYGHGNVRRRASPWDKPYRLDDRGKPRAEKEGLTPEDLPGHSRGTKEPWDGWNIPGGPWAGAGSGEGGNLAVFNNDAREVFRAGAGENGGTLVASNNHGKTTFQADAWAHGGAMRVCKHEGQTVWSVP